MGILNGPLINDLKPQKKNRRTLDRFEFDKKKPLGPYNFPVFSYAKYRIHGYTEDAAGLRRPYPPIIKTLPMGQRIRFVKKDLPENFVITGCERVPGGPILEK